MFVVAVVIKALYGAAVVFILVLALILVRVLIRLKPCCPLPCVASEMLAYLSIAIIQLIIGKFNLV